jgi:iron complex outermembrane receptor protein
MILPRQIKILLVSLGLGTALLHAALGHAQQSTEQIERVLTTAKRIPSDTEGFAGSLSLIGQDELQRTMPLHIQQSLNQVAGVGVHRGDGQEYLAAIRSPVFTGSGACGEFLMMEDGIPLNSVGLCNVNELFSSHYEMAQRIEVVRGPAAVYYGSNAVHGVINVVGEDNTYDGARVGLELGANDFLRGKLSLGKGDDESGLGLNFSANQDGGFRVNSAVEQQKASLRYRKSMEKGQFTSAISLTNLQQQTAGYLEGLDSYKNAAAVRSNGLEDAYRDASSARWWGKFEQQISTNTYMDVTPYWRWSEMDFLMHFLPGTPTEQNRQYGAGVQSTAHSQLSATLTLTYGVDLEYANGSLLQAQDGPTMGSAFLQATVPQGKQYDYDVNSQMLSPFVMAGWDFAQRWQLTAGLRYEVLAYDYSNNMLAGRSKEDGSECGFGGCRYSRPPSGKDSFYNSSSKLGLSYSGLQDHLIYLNYAKGFRAPQATELYRLQREQTTASLSSEQIDSVEWGIKGHNAGLHYQLALYAMEKDHVIYRDSDFFNLSDGQTRHLGTELELSYQTDSDWDFAANYSYAKHTYTHDEVLGSVNIRGNDMDSAPRHMGNLSIGWQALSALSLSMDLQYMGRYFTDAENEHEYPGHSIVNLSANWQIMAAMQLNIRLNNLSDRAYAERADYTNFSQERYFPGRPREIYAGLEYTW